MTTYVTRLFSENCNKMLYDYVYVTMLLSENCNTALRDQLLCAVVMGRAVTWVAIGAVDAVMGRGRRAEGTLCN